MKGVIFTELVSFMEKALGIIAADDILTRADLPNGGAFTSVGSYPYTDAIKLVSLASDHSGIPVEELCQSFGSHLLDRFGVLFPNIMDQYKTVDDLLGHVGPHIHEEVRILYPGAQPPSVSARQEGDDFILTYESHRPFAHIAYGLIRRSLETYGDTRTLTWEASPASDRAVFRLAKAT